MKNPCHGCTERVIPTKDDPRTCHGKCPREAEYLAQDHAEKAWMRKQEREGREVKAIWDGKTKRVHRSRGSGEV